MRVVMTACHDENKNQKWVLSPGGEVRHEVSGLCLDMGEGKPGQEVSVQQCDRSPRQVWRFDYYEEDKQDWRPELQP